MSVSKNRPIRRLVGWLRQNFPIVKNCVHVYFTDATSPPTLPLLKLSENIVFVFGLHILYFFTSFLARAYSCLQACAFTLYRFVIGPSLTIDKCHGDICPSDHCNISIRNCQAQLQLAPALLLHSRLHKCDQGTLGTQRSTLIGPRTCICPSMDPVMTLQYTPHGYMFAFYDTKMGLRDSGDTKVNSHWV